MTIEKRLSDGFVILSIHGKITVGESANLFDETLERVLSNDKGHVVLDISKVSYMDSTGISVLVGYLNRFGKESRKLILVNPSRYTRRLLEIANLIDLFPVYRTLQEALGAEQ